MENSKDSSVLCSKSDGKRSGGDAREHVAELRDDSIFDFTPIDVTTE